MNHNRPLDATGVPHGVGRKSLTRPDWNVAQLARESGVSHSHLCQILRGQRMPSLPVAARLAEALGLPHVEDLLIWIELWREQNELFKQGKITREEIWAMNSTLNEPKM
jgi:transcriptional regulator with XRE-family HTH domain